MKKINKQTRPELTQVKCYIQYYLPGGTVLITTPRRTIVTVSTVKCSSSGGTVPFAKAEWTVGQLRVDVAYLVQL